MKLRTTRVEDLLQADPLRDFFVWWDEIQQGDVDALQAALDTATGERDLQRYLETHPIMLIQHLGGGHGRWVIPQQKLGAEHVTDFVVGDKDSTGFHWVAVELESPKAKMFTRSGDQTRQLGHAIRQVLDWRSWLTTNQNYAARKRDEGGLGLRDIDGNVPGLIVIGRERDLDQATRNLRRQLSGKPDIEIHTYDWLVRLARGRVESLRRRDSFD